MVAVRLKALTALLVMSCAGFCGLALAASAESKALIASAQQTIQIGEKRDLYPFVVFANTDLKQVPSTLERAVVILHGVERNADEYFATGLKLLRHAQVVPGTTLLLAPNFLIETDPRASAGVPLWRKDNWMQGETSEFGHVGVTSFQALDDIVGYLADRKRFPGLKEIVLIGHSAGAQLMQRYAVFNDQDAVLKQAGIQIRYVISSPSSYVYFDGSRPQAQSFAPVLSVMCPSYNQYRYGIEKPPTYLKSQNLSAAQLFQRYAARDVTYIVGANDNDPNHRVLDKSCGAEMQGESRVVRQHNYLHYEQFLAQKWKVAVHHPQFEVEGVAHSAKGIYSADLTAETLFPDH
jgi:pimeloyl-ACP methyl ester carboxylesterase